MLGFCHLFIKSIDVNTRQIIGTPYRFLDDLFHLDGDFQYIYLLYISLYILHVCAKENVSRDPVTPVEPLAAFSCIVIAHD